MYRLLVASVLCMAVSSCTPDSQKDATPDRAQFKNLRLEAGQLTGHVAYHATSGSHMQWLVLLEGIYFCDEVWGSEWQMIESGHRRPLPSGATPPYPARTAIRVTLSNHLDPEDLVAVRLRAVVWFSKAAPHEANQGDIASFSYQSARFPVSDADAK